MVLVAHDLNGDHHRKISRQHGPFAYFLVLFGCVGGSFLTLCLITSKLVDLNLEDSIEYGNVRNQNSNGLRSTKDVFKGENYNSQSVNEDPISIDEIIIFFNNFLSTLHEKFQNQHRTEYDGVWKIYHDYALEVLYPWDREYLQRMPKRRNDDSVFLSIATYRDESCLNTMTWAYEKAKNPDKLNVGIVQQNCMENCLGGLVDGKAQSTPPDPDCHKLFCESEIGKQHCAAGRIRALHINEDESLGPYAARYFGSKLWYGEQWYIQMDAHMTFLQDWDAVSINMMKKAPSEKPVMSHYPPHDTNDLEADRRNGIVNRLCGAYFADSGLEEQIIRLGGYGGDAFGPYIDTPRFAPYTGAGYFVAPSTFLHEVPFDPFLPWIFMGEEIIMSSRLWTHGYDIFSPNVSVVGHIYQRKQKPKFWESVNRLFHVGIHTPLQLLVLQRVKSQILYPESTPDIVKPQSVLSHINDYSMGTKRKLEDFFSMVGLDMQNKRFLKEDIEWCYKGTAAPGYQQYEHLYPPNLYNTGYIIPDY